MSSIHIEIIKKIPYSVLCSGVSDDFDIKNNDYCFFADKNGYAFGRVDSHVESLPVLFIQDATTTDMIGLVPIKIDRYMRLIDFYNKVVSSKNIVHGLLVSDTVDELYIANRSVDADDNKNIAVVYFLEKNSLDETFVNLVSFLEHMKSKDPLLEFSEIKLQFPPNVYYTEIK